MPVPSGPPRRTIRTIEVASSARLSPSIQRVTTTGSSLTEMALGSPGGHIKLFLPPLGERHAVVPTMGPDGLVFPADAPRPVVRTYTPRELDPAGQRLVIDVALHGEGPGASWARHAQPGDRLGVAGPGRGYDPDPDAPWFLLAGDETAMPAVIAIAAALPSAASGQILLEVPDAADAQPVPAPPGVRVTYLPRGAAPAGDRMESAVLDVPAPPDGGRAWIAGEAALVRRLRGHLRQGLGLPADHVVVRGYWKRGVADHPDHDYGDES